MRSRRRSVMWRSSARPVAGLVAARVLIEGIAFGSLLAIAQALAGGAVPLPFAAATTAVTGVALVLVAALREMPGERRGGAIVAATLIASIGLALALPTRSLDTVGWLARLIVFALLGEAFLWRVLSIARGAIRWTDARNASPFAAIALGLAAVFP